MIRRRAVIGLALLSALVFSAFAASSALAVEETTAVTCKKVASGKQFSDEHCLTANEGAGEGWKHETIPVGTETEITGSNEKTGAGTTSAVHATLTAVAGGLVTEITCKKVVVTGNLKNEEPTLGKMQIKGSKILIHYTECTVPKPVGQNCKIPSETIQTNAISATTTAKKMNIEFKPTVGTEFASFSFEGCKTAGLNVKYEVTGSVLAIPNGATLSTTEAQTTTDNTLKFGGKAAGLEGSITLRMAGAGGEPISTTTF
jgi:hypothetical protein